MSQRHQSNGRTAMDMRESELQQQKTSSKASTSPQQRTAIASEVARLLLHYWTGDDRPEVRAAQARDWIDDLIEFPFPIVLDSCTAWRRSESRRPTPADIRKLCIERQADDMLALPAPEMRQAREERRRRVDAGHKRDQLEGRAYVNSWAQRQGYADIDMYAAAKGIHWSDAYRMIMARSTLNGPVTEALYPAAWLGASAREFNPTAEQLRRGRIALGLEAAELVDDEG